MRGRRGNERDERQPGSQHSLAQQWQCGREIVFLNMHGFWLNEGLRKGTIISDHCACENKVKHILAEKGDERPGKGTR